MASLIQPLSSQVPIVDEEGHPLPSFITLLQKLGVGTGLDGSSGLITFAAIAAKTILANKTGSSAAPTACTISDILDFVSSTRGTLLFRGVAGWAALAPDTAGKVLQTNGAGADPTWVAAAGGGGRFVANLGTLRPLTDFTQDNTNANRTIVENSGKAISFVAKSTAAATNVHGLRRAEPGSTPYRVAMFVQTNNPGNQFYGIAAGWSNGTAHHLAYDQSGGLEYAPWTNSSTRGAVTSLTGRAFPTGLGLWFAVRNDGTNWIWEISGDGGNFHPVRSMVKVAGYTQIYLGLFSFNNGTSAESSASVLYYDESGLTRTAN